jgi:hypothetical protein
LDENVFDGQKSLKSENFLNLSEKDFESYRELRNSNKFPK